MFGKGEYELTISANYNGNIRYKHGVRATENVKNVLLNFVATA